MNALNLNIEDALTVVERCLVVFEQCAEETGDRALRIYAERGIASVADLSPADMLDRVRSTAHILVARFERLFRERALEGDKLISARRYKSDLEMYIRAALYLLHPDRYSFCEDSLAEALGPQEVTP